MNTFILAMVCYPEVQAKAQEEIDRVLGAGHLPNFADEPSLPYVAAVVKEVLRRVSYIILCMRRNPKIFSLLDGKQ